MCYKVIYGEWKVLVMQEVISLGWVLLCENLTDFRLQPFAFLSVMACVLHVRTIPLSLPTPSPLQTLLCLLLSLMWQLSFYFLLKSGPHILGCVMIINYLLFAYCETWFCCLFVKVYEILVHWKFALRAELGVTNFHIGNWSASA